VGARGGARLAAYLGTVVGLFAIALLLCVAGAVDGRTAPAWNPAIPAVLATGLAYVVPRPSLWQAFVAGVVFGLAYAGFVLAADALGVLQLHVGPADVVLQALIAGVLSSLAARLLVNWFARRGSR